MALRPTLDKDLCMVHWDGLELPYFGCVYEKLWNMQGNHQKHNPELPFSSVVVLHCCIFTNE